MISPSPNTGQAEALKVLLSGENVFLTGAAGTGKSFVVQQFLQEADSRVALLATTGAASIIIDGRTFHSFFGLWNFHADYEGMVKSALQSRATFDRLRAYDCIVIDEVSMLNSRTIAAGERIAREVRGNHEPWGGLQVIATGDFCQLPPVTTKRDRDEGWCPEGKTDWVFNSEVWEQSNFRILELTEIMRTSESRFLGVLGKLRRGDRDPEVQSFLEERRIALLAAEKADIPFLFSRQDDVRAHNMIRLTNLPGAEQSIETHYMGNDSGIEKLKKNAPIEEKILLRAGALIMIRKNDPDGFPYRYANGTLGHYHGIDPDGNMEIELLDGGEEIAIPKHTFHWRDGKGEVQAEATNYPVHLAWATTIHKSQGATMDRLIVDMGNIWESGQAYVAVSRVRGEGGLNVLRAGKGKVFLDPDVSEFYKFEHPEHPAKTP